MILAELSKNETFLLQSVTHLTLAAYWLPLFCYCPSSFPTSIHHVYACNFVASLHVLDSFNFSLGLLLGHKGSESKSLCIHLSLSFLPSGRLLRLQNLVPISLICSLWPKFSIGFHGASPLFGFGFSSAGVGPKAKSRQLLVAPRRLSSWERSHSHKTAAVGWLFSFIISILFLL